MKKNFIYVLIFIQTLALAFSGNMLSPVLTDGAEVGDKIGIAIMSPFILGALVLVLLIGFGLLIYTRLKKHTGLKTITIVEVVFLIAAIILALVFLISMNII